MSEATSLSLIKPSQCYQTQSDNTFLRVGSITLLFLGCVAAGAGALAYLGHCNTIGLYLEGSAALSLGVSLILHLLKLHRENLQKDLTLAIQNKDYKKISRLANQGADLNLYNRQGETLLTCAVRAKDLRLVKALSEAGALLDKTNRNGKRPIDLAVKNYYVKIANYLWKQGSGLDVRLRLKDKAMPYEGNPTSLNEAIDQNDADAVWGLLLKGHSLDAGEDGDKPYEQAYLGCKETLYPLLKEYDKEFAHLLEIRERRLLAHIFSIGGETKVGKNTFPLERASPLESEMMLRRALKNLPQKCHQKCHLYFSPNASDLEIYNRIQANEGPVFFPGIMRLDDCPADHVVGYMVIGENLWVGDIGPMKWGGLVCFQKKITQEDIKVIRQIRGTLAQCCEQLSTLFEKRGFTFVSGEPLKLQKISNCAWVSFKTLFRGFFNHYYPGLDSNDSKTLYKDFTFNVRKAALEKYLKESTHPDRELLKKILEKMQAKKDLRYQSLATLISKHL